MNSFLQALYQISEFRDSILSLDDSFQAPDHKLISKVKLTLYQIQRLYT